MPQGAVCYSFSFALTRDRLAHWVGEESLNQKEFQKEDTEKGGEPHLKEGVNGKPLQQRVIQ